MNAFEKIKKLLSERGTQQYEYVPILHETVLGRKIIAVERALEIVSEVEAEYINKSTEHINKLGDCSTNADRIRAMSDEELAEWVFKHDGIVQDFGRMTKSETLRWMKSPVKKEPET